MADSGLYEVAHLGNNMFDDAGYMEELLLSMNLREQTFGVKATGQPPLNFYNNGAMNAQYSSAYANLLMPYDDLDKLQTMSFLGGNSSFPFVDDFTFEDSGQYAEVENYPFMEPMQKQTVYNGSPNYNFISHVQDDYNQYPALNSGKMAMPASSLGSLEASSPLSYSSSASLNSLTSSSPTQLYYGANHSVLLRQRNSSVSSLKSGPQVRLNRNTMKSQSGDSTKKKYRLVRGISAGGCYTRPPKNLADSNAVYLPVFLELLGANMPDICFPSWSDAEKEDGRRIVSIKRSQEGSKVVAEFSILGSAKENPSPLPAPPDTDVLEVSCLECPVLPDENEDDVDGDTSRKHAKVASDGSCYQYYITSVEVIEIVELLLGTYGTDVVEKRRERCRIRSNLVPFWCKRPISSRVQDQSPPFSKASAPSNHDYRVELARRIMSYETRKPRGFDREVRILRWDKLVPALKRALQSYYVEFPKFDSYYGAE